MWKDPLSFVIWIFRSGQPHREDDRWRFLARISAKEQHSLVWVAIASAAEICPWNHCTWHMSWNIKCAVKCKLHAPVMMEYYYWWKGSWLLEMWSHDVVVEGVFNLPPLSIPMWRSWKEAGLWMSVVFFITSYLGYMRCR